MWEAELEKEERDFNSNHATQKLEKTECNITIEFVNRTQRQYKTALTGAIKIQMKTLDNKLKAALQCKIKFGKLKQATLGEVTICA